MREAYGTGTGLLFLVAGVASLVTLLCVLLMKEVPLRTTVDVAEVDPDTGEITVVTRQVDPVEAAGLRMQRAETGQIPVIDPDATGLRRGRGEQGTDPAQAARAASTAEAAAVENSAPERSGPGRHAQGGVADDAAGRPSGRARHRA